MKVKLDPGAYIPERAHPEDAGPDIRSPIDAVVPAWGSVDIDTGVHVELPTHSAGLLKSKSGLLFKHGLTSEGVVDQGFSGSIHVKLMNHTPDRYKVLRGDKISQLVVIPIFRPLVNVVDALDETERGDAGFGSTGR